MTLPEFQKKDISKKQFWTAQNEVTEVTQNLEVLKLQSLIFWHTNCEYTETLWTVYELAIAKWLPSEIHNA